MLSHFTSLAHVALCRADICHVLIVVLKYVKIMVKKVSCVLETELVQIYVPTCCCDIGKREKEREREQKRKGEGKDTGRKGNGKSKEFVFSLWFDVVGAFPRGDCKLLESEIVRIYVNLLLWHRENGKRKGVLGALAAPLGCWKVSARRCSLTLGYLQLDTCTCSLTLGY